MLQERFAEYPDLTHDHLREVHPPSCNVQARLKTSGPAQSPSLRGGEAVKLPFQTTSTGSGLLQAWDVSVSPLVSSFKAASEALGSEVTHSARLR